MVSELLELGNEKGSDSQLRSSQNNASLIFLKSVGHNGLLEVHVEPKHLSDFWFIRKISPNIPFTLEKLVLLFLKKLLQ